MREQSLYERLGGRTAIETVVDDFYDRVLSDDRLRGYFEDTSVAELRAHQVQFVSAVAGGPVEYDGGDMREAHAHLDIAEADFETVADYLAAALRENGVEEADVDAVMKEIAALKAPVLDR